MYGRVICALLMLTLATHSHAQNNWAAAACVSLGPRCSHNIARTSGHCRKRTWMSSQSRICRQAACQYCYQSNRRVAQGVCRSDPIVKNCFGGRRPGPMPRRKSPRRGRGNGKGRGKGRGKGGRTKSKPKRSNGKCNVFRGANNKVVIPTSRMAIRSAWTRNGDGSITWKKGGGNGIDGAGSGSICSRFTVPSSGTYYMTAISSAPHPTEHNDGWFRLNAGFRLFRPQGNKYRNGGSGWLKGYENAGGNRKANYLLHVDFDGHQFITNSLKARKVYTVCISGRSSKYTIYELMFIKCSGSAQCSRYNGHIKKAMRSLPPSGC